MPIIVHICLLNHTINLLIRKFFSDSCHDVSQFCCCDETITTLVEDLKDKLNVSTNKSQKSNFDEKFLPSFLGVNQKIQIYDSKVLPTLKYPMISSSVGGFLELLAMSIRNSGNSIVPFSETVSWM